MGSRYLVSFFLIVLLAGFAACKNNDNVFTPVYVTGLTVVNAGNDTLNFYVNGTRQNNLSNLFPGGSLLQPAEIAGAQNYQFKKFSSQAISFSVPLTLTKNTYNSLYIAGNTTDRIFSTVDTLYRATLASKATIRFVHTSPDIGNLDVYVGDSVSFKSLVYKKSAPFQVFTTGARTVKIYQSGSLTPLVDTLISFSANRVYTLITRGSLTGRGTSVFNVGVVQNF